MASERNLSFTFTGWKAVSILLLLALVFACRLLVTHKTVEPEVEELIRRELAAECARALLPAIEQDVAEQNAASLQANVERLTASGERIAFVSLRRRGSRYRMVVRADILIDGAVPANGRPVRYFRINYVPLLGYVYEMEAFAADYYLPFME